MPTTHKSGRSLGRLFGHRKGNDGKSNLSIIEVSERDQTVGDAGVRKEDVVWDPQGRILNWKSVVSEIQKQVCVAEICDIEIPVLSMNDYVLCRVYGELIEHCSGHFY